MLMGLSAENLPSNRFDGFMDKPSIARVSDAISYISNRPRAFKLFKARISSIR